MKLVIVESPTKVKTISRYLGGDVAVEASVGHIRDLPKRGNAVDTENGFVPVYEIPEKKKAVVQKLKKEAKNADKIILATDPDREGEAIAWHITQTLDLPESKFERVTFYEITEEAVREAFRHPRALDEHLIKAQEARRVLDRLVGYELSGLIWKKLRYGLSAGRVQSPALRILAEREREINSFVPESFWILSIRLKTGRGDVISFTAAEEIWEEKKAVALLKVLEASPRWLVKEIKESEAEKNPPAPFITSSLQQSASSRLGLSPSNAMRLAQKLYEAGRITYMRTDSTHLSNEALGQIHGFIAAEHGENYLSPRLFKTKTKNAQEAHEAIRPTQIAKRRSGNSEAEKKLYELIWKRAVASQMTAAKVLRTKVVVAPEGQSLIPDFTVNGARVIFPGWLKIDPAAHGDDTLLPALQVAEPLQLVEALSERKETLPPNRYSEAGLIKELEKRGIGRPSTYATILQTLIARGYVEKIQRSLKVTDTGEVVSSFLEKHFPNIVSDTFTAEMEEELDEIADGKRAYRSTLEDFYRPFKKEVEAKQDIPKITNLGEADPKFRCPVCGNTMIIKLARIGKFLSCSLFPECIGARKIDGSEMAPPKEIGEACPECKTGQLVEKEGRFGRFVACSNYPKCKHIKKNAILDPSQSTGVRCPQCRDSQNLPDGYMVERRGRFGPFFSCSNYPQCKHIVKTRPTGNLCSLCGALMMEGTKTIPERCSNKLCPNHNPHKLEKN